MEIYEFIAFFSHMYCLCYDWNRPVPLLCSQKLVLWCCFLDNPKNVMSHSLWCHLHNISALFCFVTCADMLTTSKQYGGHS